MPSAYRTPGTRAGKSRQWPAECCPGTVSGQGYPGSFWATPRIPRTSCTRPPGASRESLTGRVGLVLGYHDALGVGAPVPPGHGPQLADARRPGQDDQEHTADGREQQGHAEREVTVRAHVRDVYLGAILQDEDQQEQQDDGEETHRDPQPADPGSPDLVLGKRRRCLLWCGWLRRSRRRRTARCEYPGICSRRRPPGVRH